MNVVCIGGGPAGLYFGILTKLRDPSAEVCVVERNPRGVTHGWSVVFWDDLVRSLRASDPKTASAIMSMANEWYDQQVQIGRRNALPQRARMGGYGYSVGRTTLLQILTDRAESLGVKIDFSAGMVDVSAFPDADLVVAADGVNSRTRTLLAPHLRPAVNPGRNYYIWLGTRKLFNVFTFAFEESTAGWVWLHAYRFSKDYSTVIFECAPETWHGLGLDKMTMEEGLVLLQRLFSSELGGHELINQAGPTGQMMPWLNFVDVTNQRWYHGNVVLMGDAAHTTHFSIGSGTKLAMEDAIWLDRALRAYTALPKALAAYQAERSRVVVARQGEARASTVWFDNIAHHIETDPVHFAYALRTRRQQPSGISWMLHQATQYKAGQVARRWVSNAKRRLQ